MGLLGEAVDQGVPASRLASLGLRLALDRSQGDLRGARWCHAFLALEAAGELAAHCPAEIALPAVVNALVFLESSEPTRFRASPDESRPADPEAFAHAVCRGDLPEAEAHALALDRAGELEQPWFQLASSNLAGWGHRPLIGLATWRLRSRLPEESERLVRAGLRHWIPWEQLRGERGAAPLSSASAKRLEACSAGEEFVTALSEVLLAGEGDGVVGHALEQGRSPTELVDALLRTACRVFAALPELRQLHGVTVTRALGEAVLDRAAPAATVLRSAALFVVEGWLLALKSGRVLPEAAHYRLGVPTEGPEASLMKELCERDATPNFGHLVKLTEASLGLRSMLGDGPAQAWATEILRAGLRKGTPWRRVWATVSSGIL
ncbi:MAG: hypothetical protein VX498_14525 [Myxococcota bacterium]|nr:hypothetical protein [Myxococcota bacterium]